MSTTRVYDFLRTGGLKLVHMNTRSMFKKRQDIFDQLDGTDIVTMSETWLHPEYDDDLINWDGMKLFRQDRSNKKGGGIVVYIRDDLDCEVNIRRDLCINNKDLECFVLDIILKNDLKMQVVTLYRPPSGKLDNFFPHVKKLMKLSLKDGVEQWMLGDININTLREGTASSVTLSDLCKFKGFHKLIHQCTRPFGNSVACLDNILTSYNGDMTSGVLNFLVSDHLPVFCVKTKLKIEYLKKSLRVRNYKYFDVELFKDWLSEADWEDFYNLKDPDVAWLFILNHIYEYLDVNCPWETISVVDKRNRWMTGEILGLIGEREDAVDSFLRTRKTRYLTRAKQLRCRINKAIIHAKADYIKESLEQTKKDPKKFWRIINNVLKPEVSVEPPILIGEDGFMKSNLDSVNYLNDYFSGIGQQLSDNMSDKGHPVRTIFDEPVESVYPKIVVNRELVDILFGEININKTSGIEGLRCDVLKCALRFLLDQMTWLYQLSFDEGIFPTPWKCARVNPIPKTGNQRLITNWRPISLLPVPSKIAEKIMHIHLTDVLDQQHFLTDHQYGYRQGRGTGDAIFRFLNNLYESRDRGHLTVACYLDLKKAFDSVHHGYLIEVLGKLGLHDCVLNWLMCYLNGREQYTRIGSFCSGSSPVQFGVPQGSVLGPLLFIIFINDVTLKLGNCGHYIYADDLVVFHSANRTDLVEDRMRQTLRLLSEWFVDKRLTVNVDKSKIIWYGSTQKLPKAKGIEFVLDNVTLETVNCYKYLGLKIDSSLSLEPAMRELNSKVNHKLFRFGKVRGVQTEEAAVLVYKTTIMSLFDYSSFCQEGVNGGLLKKFDRMQKRGLKICYMGRVLREAEMYKLSKLPTLKRRRQELLLTYMYKLSHIEDMLDLRPRRDGLRSSKKIKFKVPRARNAGYTKSPLYRGAEMWDKLGDWYQTSRDKLTFKKRIRTILDLEAVNGNPKDLLEEDSVLQLSLEEWPMLT